MLDIQKRFSLNDEDTNFSLKHVLIASVIITLFVDVILFYYSMLHAEKRNSIIMNGQMTAMRSANQLSDYLSTCIDTVKLTAYTLEGMQTAGIPTKEISDYLAWQSTTVKNTVFENTPGMYGYINGEFIDGSLWVPDENFSPTKRPWYIKAIALNGEIAIVDPYLDAQSGTVMMTVAKSLADGKSVVAMDIALEKIQQIAERAVAKGDSDVEIILDSRNMVVAHSDTKEIGKNYDEGENTIWAQLARRIRAENVNFLESEYEDAQYIVYAAKTEGDWLCLSVKNATEVFQPLRILMGVTITVVLLVMLTLAYIMNRSNQQYQMANKLNKQLASISNIYMSMYDVNVDRNLFSEIKTVDSHLSRLAKEQKANARTIIKTRALEAVDASSLKDVLRFIDIDTLSERLRHTETVAIEFMTTFGRWARLRYIVSERNDDGSLSRVLLVAEDIDKEKKERDELVDMSERALAASEAKSAFLSNMSHEIRTPINAMLGMNEMILRECEGGSIRSYSESIKAAGDTLLGIINDILDFSKIEAGKLELLPVEYDLSSVLNDLVNMVQTRADDKGLALTLDFDKNTPKRLYGDEVRVKQIITNILTNAVKYTEKGSVTFSVGFERIEEEPDSAALLVSVADTGIGIKPEDMKRLFTEFERIEEKRNRNVEGTGLGMAITQNLLNLMGTSLQVESTYGVGSKFYFRLVQKVVKWEPLGDYATSYQALLNERKTDRKGFTAPQAQILAVDDNQINLIVFDNLLKRTRVKIDTASDGDKGLLLAQAKKYDLIFLDHMMPNKDGVETLQELRARKDGPNCDTPAICLTANAVSGAREQYIEAGFNDYLTKPVDSEKLEDILLTYLPKEKIEAADTEETDEEETVEIPEALAPLQGQDWIDIPLGIKNSGDQKSYLPLLKIFYESLDEKTNEIAGYYAAENWNDYTIKVHALKSSARLIGAAAFSEEAQLLENAGKNGDVDYIRTHHEEFLAKCRSFKEPLSKVFPENKTDEEKPEADAELMASVLDEIRSAAENGDGNLLDGVFAEMAEYRIPGKEARLWTKLKEEAEQRNFEGILALLPKA